jgi:hypothetical protein
MNKELKDSIIPNVELRLLMGEAYVLCNECYARLYSIEGNSDRLDSCPYKKDEKGRCTDTLLSGEKSLFDIHN